MEKEWGIGDMTREIKQGESKIDTKNRYRHCNDYGYGKDSGTGQRAKLA
jgi:hypothetical protein